MSTVPVWSPEALGVALGLWLAALSGLLVNYLGGDQQPQRGGPSSDWGNAPGVGAEQE